MAQAIAISRRSYTARIWPWAIVAAVICSLSIGGFLLVRHLQTSSAPAVSSSNQVAPQQCALTPGGILSYINGERSRLGIGRLTVDSRLVTTSKEKLNAMISEQYVGHDSPKGVTAANLIAAQGLRGVSYSEDVDPDTLTDSQTWESFKSSPLHYASLTDQTYRHVGISVDCHVNYIAKTDTAPSINGDQTGLHVTSLVIVHLTN